MCRYLSLAVLGIAGLVAAPAASQAQYPFGVGVQVGPVGVAVQPGYPYLAPNYVAPSYFPPAPVIVNPLVGSRSYAYPWYRNGFRGARRGGWANYNHQYYHGHRR